MRRVGVATISVSLRFATSADIAGAEASRLASFVVAQAENPARSRLVGSGWRLPRNSLLVSMNPAISVAINIASPGGFQYAQARIPMGAYIRHTDVKLNSAACSVV